MSTRALVVWGGWEGHTPLEAVRVFVPRLEARGWTVTVSDTLDAYRELAAMADLGLIVQCWTLGRLEPEQERGLLDAVAGGVGFAGWHGGIIDSFRESSDYQWMTGGQFVGHPGDCVPSYRVEIADREHPITRGIGDFELADTEQYLCHVDPSNSALATTTFTGEHGDATRYRAGTVSPYAWTRTWGEGRVFVAAWGHTDRDFEVPEARVIAERGLVWAAR